MTHPFPTRSSSDLMELSAIPFPQAAGPLGGLDFPPPFPHIDDCGGPAPPVIPTHRKPPTPAPKGRAFLMPNGPQGPVIAIRGARERSEEHTSELQSLMRIWYAVFCLKKTDGRPSLHPRNH